MRREVSTEYVKTFGDANYALINHTHSGMGGGFAYFKTLLKNWICTTVTAVSKISSLYDYLPYGSNNKYTATEDCIVCFSIVWDCDGNDGYKVVVSDGTNSFEPFYMPARETSESKVDQFYGTFNLPKGWSFYFYTTGDSLKKFMYHTCNVYSIAS